MAKKRDFLIAISCLFPALLIYVVLVINPIIQSAYLSFFSWNGIPDSPLEFVALENFKTMFSSLQFWNSFKNSGLFILVSFAFQLPLAFILASIITRKVKGLRFFKTAFFTPVVLPMTAVGIIWTYILYPNGGVLNTLLSWIGLKQLVHDWLGNPQTTTMAVAFVSSWVYAGLNMIIIAAGLVAIPEEIYESGEIEGATGFKKLVYITLPMLVETLKIYAVLAITGSLKVFDIVFVMTGGGPNRASEVPAILLYNESFKFNNFGFGSTVGTFILVTGIIISVVLNKILYRYSVN